MTNEKVSKVNRAIGNSEMLGKSGDAVVADATFHPGGRSCFSLYLWTLFRHFIARRPWRKVDWEHNTISLWLQLWSGVDRTHEMRRGHKKRDRMHKREQARVEAYKRRSGRGAKQSA